MSTDPCQDLSAQALVDTLGEGIGGILALARVTSGKPVSELRAVQLEGDRWIIELLMPDPDEEFAPGLTIFEGFGSSPLEAIATLRMVQA